MSFREFRDVAASRNEVSIPDAPAIQPAESSWSLGR